MGTQNRTGQNTDKFSARQFAARLLLLRNSVLKVMCATLYIPFGGFRYVSQDGLHDVLLFHLSSPMQTVVRAHTSTINALALDRCRHEYATVRA